uniref:non-specific serine/threonine protein kinase n=1 Tax=Dicentrarchus labrax TaxID=13489 RepID=A0A8P4KEE9_DICLA
MDLPLLCTVDQTQSPPALTDSQTGNLESLSLLHSPTESTLSAYETGAETVSEPTDKSTKTLSNVPECLSQEKTTDLDCQKPSSSSYNMSECLSLCSEPSLMDEDFRVFSYFGSSEPLLPHLSHDLISPLSESFSEFYVKQEPALCFSPIQENSTPQPLMEPSFTEPIYSHSFSSKDSQATYLLRSLSHQSDSLESDTAIAPVSDLYIFESDTHDFILSPNVDPEEIKCPEYRPLSQTGGKKSDPDCDSQSLMCDSENVVTQCHHGSSEERAMVDYESDVSQPTRLRPPAVNACEAGLMSVNDARRGKAEVTDLTPQPRRNDSPIELWLDACQYLAGEDIEDRDVSDKTGHSVMQGGLTATSDLSFPTGETQVSCYNPDGSEVIGWSGDDTGGWGPPVERWSSVDSWASALSDWTGIIAAPPEDFTAAFTEIGAEIDALTQALAEVNTHIDTETSKEGEDQESAVQAQSQPSLMGIQDQPLKAQNIPESSVLSGQSRLSSVDRYFTTKPGVDREGRESSTNLCFLTTHTLTNSHCTKSDTLRDLVGACQLEPQWGSPKFIMPLAPLSSSFIHQTNNSLEGDQTYGITDKPYLEGVEELIHKKENTLESSDKSSPDRQLDLDTAECFFTTRKTVIEEINDLSRELSNLAVVPADQLIISEKNRIAFITLDLNDPFVSRASSPIATVVQSKFNQKTAERMPHKTHKSTSEGKTRSKKDKSAGHHHGAQASKKQENLSHHVSAGPEDKEAKLVIETGVATEKAPSKTHGKKKKKHAQNATGVKSVGEPLVEVENGAKPKTAKGRIEMFEATLGVKAGKAQKDSDQSHSTEKKSQQPEAKASQGEQVQNKTDHKDHKPKNFTSPLNDDIIKRRRLSEHKFGKIVSVLESKIPKPEVSIQTKGEEPKVDAGETRKKAYSEVVKQKIPPKEEPKVLKPIQAVAVSGDPQSLCLWCQFAAVFSHHTVTWGRDGTVLSEIKRSAGDESRVSLNISNASHKDLGKYECRLTSLHGSVTLDYLLTYEGIIHDLTLTTILNMDKKNCSRLMFKEDFLSDQYFGENQPVSILTEKVHFGEGMHRRAFRTKLHVGQIPLLLPGHSCVLKVHNAISYGTKNNDELVQKNFTLAVEECQVQNTAREYIKAYTTAAQSVEAFGEIPEIIPIYLVHRPSNDIPYATLEEELIGDFVKYSVKDGKEINLMRRDSEAGQKCCAFQHWVYDKTEGNLLVTDMQGVGMRLTDVGIATCKKGYKGFKGNCATSFIDQFKALHQCNKYCELLGLKSLQPKAKKPASAPKPKPQPPAAPKKKTFGPTVKGKS